MLTILSDWSIGSAIYIYTYMHMYTCTLFFLLTSQYSGIPVPSCRLLEPNNIWSQTRPNNSSLLFVQCHLGHSMFYYFGCIKIFLFRSLTTVFLSLLFVVFTPYCLCNSDEKQVTVNPWLLSFDQQPCKDTNTYSFTPKALCQRDCFRSTFWGGWRGYRSNTAVQEQALL